MTILLANCCSFFPKLNELTLLLPATQPLVICLTETWLTPSVSEPEVTLDGYTLFEVTVQCPNAEAALLYMLNPSLCLLILRPMLPVNVLTW